MDTANTNETFIPVKHAAVRLGVPAAWLRAEALANRIPCLVAGRRILVNPQAVARVLLDRAHRVGKVPT